MIKAVIIDDESSNRELLRIMLRDFCPEILLVGEADSLESGKKIISEQNPALVFLDIEMPSGSGFDLLRKIPNRNFDVIFITAYNQYGLLAFKFSATDYILKPIDPNELSSAVEKAITKQAEKNDPIDHLLVLLENIGKQGEPPKKIMIPDQNGFVLAEMKEIIRFTTEGSYTVVNLLGGKKIITSRALGVFEEMVAQHHFFRIHHSHLINLNFVEKYNKGRGGFVVMVDGAELEVSRRKKDDFLAKLGIRD